MATTASIAEPLHPSDAVHALETTTEREAVFELVLRAVCGTLTCAVVFSVHADELRARLAYNDGAAAPDITTLRIPRGAVLAFEEAIASRAAAIVAATSDEPFVDGMIESLRGADRQAFVMPIDIGNRAVALIVGHAGTRPLVLGELADVLPLAGAASQALAHVLVMRSRRSSPALIATDYEIEISVAEPRVDAYLNAIGAGLLLGVILWGFLGPEGFAAGGIVGVAVALLRSRARASVSAVRRRRHPITRRVRTRAKIADQ